MTAGTVEAMGTRLAAGLWRDDACALFCTHLLRLLAEGRPVSPARLAAALGSSRAAVEVTRRQIPTIEVDERGDIVASGLSLLPTPRRFRINGCDLYTWCALDTLLYPIVLEQSAQVASRCPVSGAWVRLIVTPDRLAEVEPATAHVSLVLPNVEAAGGDVRGTFCQHVHFFAGADAGAAWQAAHPEATLVPVDDAYAVARIVAQTRYRPTTR